jgi:chloramphenicol-sensitive protein RarD
VIGIAQYISPTISLLLGIFAFKEPFDRVQMLALVIIWIGLAIFTYGEIRGVREKGSDTRSPDPVS